MMKLTAVILSLILSSAALAAPKKVAVTKAPPPKAQPPHLKCQALMDKWTVKTGGKKPKTLLPTGEKSFFADVSEAKNMVVITPQGDKLVEITSGELLKARTLEAARKKRVRVEIESDQVSWLKVHFRGPEANFVRELSCDRID